MARVDPYKNFRFLLEIDGITQAGFSDCSGFGSNVEVVEYREGGDAATVRKLPGKSSYPDVTLKWGVTDSRELYDWHAAALNGQVMRKNGSIILLDDIGQEKVRWNLGVLRVMRCMMGNVLCVCCRARLTSVREGVGCVSRSVVTALLSSRHDNARRLSRLRS